MAGSKKKSNNFVYKKFNKQTVCVGVHACI